MVITEKGALEGWCLFSKAKWRRKIPRVDGIPAGEWRTVA